MSNVNHVNWFEWFFFFFFQTRRRRNSWERTRCWEMSTVWRRPSWVCTLSFRPVISAKVTSNSNVPPRWPPSIGAATKPVPNPIVRTTSDLPPLLFISIITAPWLLLPSAPFGYSVSISFGAISEQFWSNSRAVSEQFQS